MVMGELTPYKLAADIYMYEGPSSLKIISKSNTIEFPLFLNTCQVPGVWILVDIP